MEGASRGVGVLPMSSYAQGRKKLPAAERRAEGGAGQRRVLVLGVSWPLVGKSRGAPWPWRKWSCCVAHGHGSRRGRPTELVRAEEHQGEKKLNHGCWRCSAREGAWRWSRLPWGRRGGRHCCWPSSLLAAVGKKTGSQLEQTCAREKEEESGG
uniref:Uncharacterized protein n=1 Tax=Zea mays TaxID=4577 RepID=A0A804PG06_MAIZE